MKNFTSLLSLIFTVSLTVSISSGFAQANADNKIDQAIPTQGNGGITGNAAPAVVGKEIPASGSSLNSFSETNTLQTGAVDKVEMSAREKRRSRRLKKSDRKEVTQVIGNSFDTYLTNVYNVHTLQRF